MVGRVHGLGHLGRDQGGIAQVVGLDDRRVQRGKVDGGNRLLVEALARIQDHGPLVALALPIQGRDQKSVAASEVCEQQLGHDLDLLTSCQQGLPGHSGDSRHFDVPYVVHLLPNDA